MIATSGDNLLEPGAVEAYKNKLFPLATLITPNLDEAALLLETTINDRKQMESAAKALAKKYRAVDPVERRPSSRRQRDRFTFSQRRIDRVLGAVCARRRNTWHRLHVFGSNHCGSGVRLLVRTGNQTREKICHRIDRATFPLEREIRATFSTRSAIRFEARCASAPGSKRTSPSSQGSYVPSFRLFLPAL